LEDFEKKFEEFYRFPQVVTVEKMPTPAVTAVEKCQH
jgi:hypothetical protein